ncbi:hypothetical protein FACS18942_01900 [Planctomycetales bacterium]|nr:hypothetical protein FACS18942_01900 [Planctomycetales bacterium]
MALIWSREKDDKLRERRQIEMSDITELILNKQYYDIIGNPAEGREEQLLFIIPYKNYTYAVPFIFDEYGNIILKTAYPCRKYHAIYGNRDSEK